MKEIRVYLADSNTYYKNLDGASDMEDIMDCAEAQGSVYSLPNFIRAFNAGEVTFTEDTVMRMAEFENYEYVREVA